MCFGLASVEAVAVAPTAAAAAVAKAGEAGIGVEVGAEAGAAARVAVAAAATAVESWTCRPDHGEIQTSGLPLRLPAKFSFSRAPFLPGTKSFHDCILWQCLLLTWIWSPLCLVLV